MSTHPFFHSKARRSNFMKDVNGLDPQQILQLSLQILNQNKSERNIEELLILEKAVKYIKFFAELEQQTVQKLVQKIKLQHFKKDDIVFEKGEKGTCFYIILKGQVGVYIYSNSLENESLQTRAITEIDALQESNLEQKIKNLLKVNQLCTGDSFGERALINESSRLATIVCETDCYFAVLEKSEYKEILQQIEEKKIETRLNQLQEHDTFKTMSRRLLNIILYAFQDKQFTFRYYVMQQGKECKDEIYLITQGEFVIVRDNRQFARLQTGQIFGDYEAFRQLKISQHSVYCNSEIGSVLCIELDVLQKRLQATNEMPLFETLKRQCFDNYIRRGQLVKNYKNISLSLPRKRQLTFHTEFSHDGFGHPSKTNQIQELVKSKMFIMKNNRHINWKKQEHIFDLQLPRKINKITENKTVTIRSASSQSDRKKRAFEKVFMYSTLNCNDRKSVFMHQNTFLL